MQITMLLKSGHFCCAQWPKEIPRSLRSRLSGLLFDPCRNLFKKRGRGNVFGLYRLHYEEVAPQLKQWSVCR